ncbi:CHAP domain-containing protein, partial [Klebsiella pneumoniae]|nr:CHAP domain-containing protein [Klebsiella pneumoniae]
NQYGHVCIYDGAGTWYSDFKQRTLYPGPTYRQLQPAITLYRHY